jgi:uroporphyrinogen-III synthase
MADRPLHELTIVVTRPREQAAQLAQRIEQAGGIPLLFPLLEITAVPDTRPLIEQVSRLGKFELAIFISPNAVHYGIAAIRTIGELPPKLKIATVGQGSAKALLEEGVVSVIAPTERFDSEGLLALPELQDVSGWRVLIFRGDGGHAQGARRKRRVRHLLPAQQTATERGRIAGSEAGCDYRDQQRGIGISMGHVE